MKENIGTVSSVFEMSKCRFENLADISGVALAEKLRFVGLHLVMQ
jgi:hypothetical protein